jgi:hypothetical protein
MAQGKQAKTLTDAQIARMLREVEHSRYPLRDRVMVLLIPSPYQNDFAIQGKAVMDWTIFGLRSR